MYLKFDLITTLLDFKYLIRNRYQHIKPSVSIIAKVDILKADISIWGLQF